MDTSILEQALNALEFYVLREVERIVAGTGTACPVSLVNKMELCIQFNKELGMMSDTTNVEGYLDKCGYDHEFITSYINIVKNHRQENCPNEIYWDSIDNLYQAYPIDEYPKIALFEFPKEIHIAYAVCGTQCGNREFIVDGQTQVCEFCHKQMFRTEVRKYTLCENPDTESSEI